MLTIGDFCDRAKISRSMFYKLNAENKGPALTKIGRRVLISVSATNAWLASKTHGDPKLTEVGELMETMKNGRNEDEFNYLVKRVDRLERLLKLFMFDGEVK